MNPTPTPIAPFIVPASIAQNPAPAQKPFADILAAFQNHLASHTDIQPGNPGLSRLLEDYTTIQHLAVIERLMTLLIAAANTPGELQLLRMIISAMSIQERTAARRSREKVAALREARRQAKEAAAQFRQEQQAQNATRAEEQAEREANLHHAGAENATSTRSNEAAETELTSDSTSSLCHSATLPLLPEDATQSENPCEVSSTLPRSSPAEAGHSATLPLIPDDAAPFGNLVASGLSTQNSALSTLS